MGVCEGNITRENGFHLFFFFYIFSSSLFFFVGWLGSQPLTVAMMIRVSCACLSVVVCGLCNFQIFRPVHSRFEIPAHLVPFRSTPPHHSTPSSRSFHPPSILLPVSFRPALLPSLLNLILSIPVLRPAIRPFAPPAPPSLGHSLPNRISR